MNLDRYGGAEAWDAHVARAEAAHERWRRSTLCRECPSCVVGRVDIGGGASVECGFCRESESLLSWDELDMTVAGAGCYEL